MPTEDEDDYGIGEMEEEDEFSKNMDIIAESITELSKKILDLERQYRNHLYYLHKHF